MVVKHVAKQVKDQNIHNNADKVSTVANELLTNSKSHTFLLPYNGQKGEHLVRSLRKDMHRTLLENAQARICCNSTKLGTKLNISKIRLRNPTNTM